MLTGLAFRSCFSPSAYHCFQRNIVRTPIFKKKKNASGLSHACFGFKSKNRYGYLDHQIDTDSDIALHLSFPKGNLFSESKPIVNLLKGFLSLLLTVCVHGRATCSPQVTETDWLVSMFILLPNAQLGMFKPSNNLSIVY